MLKKYCSNCGNSLHKSENTAFRKRASGRSIVVNYVIRTEESDEFGEPEESGNADEIPCNDVEDALNYLKRKGPFYPSASSFNERNVSTVWLSEVEPEEDHRTGARTYHTFHLEGFSPDEMLDIYSELDRKNKIV